jgi:hypothetical protein
MVGYKEMKACGVKDTQAKPLFHPQRRRTASSVKG